MPSVHSLPAAHSNAFVPAPGIPQPPQFCGSLSWSTHVVPQVSGAFAGHEHVLLLQVLPPLQVTPQPPQFCGSLSVGMHWPLHSVVPATQFWTQSPSEQTWPEPHVIPQPPQLRSLVSVSVHTPLQLV